MEFEAKDYMFLIVSPIKGVKHFENKEKLTPRYIGPSGILDHMARWPIITPQLLDKH